MAFSNPEHEAPSIATDGSATEALSKVPIQFNNWEHGSLENVTQTNAPWPAPIGDSGVNVIPSLPFSQSNLMSEQDGIVNDIICLFRRDIKQAGPAKTGVAMEHRPTKKFRREEIRGQQEHRLSVSSKDDSVASRSIRCYQNELWYKNFEELRNYAAKNGHCVVSDSANENRTLAKWVKRQRYQYRLKKEGKHSTLSDDRELALEGLGFIWDSHGKTWEARLRELQHFKEVHGHCNVPSTYLENHSLSIWVQCQRRQYKMYCKNGRVDKKGPGMNSYRVARLENLGFIWDPRSRRHT